MKILFFLSAVIALSSIAHSDRTLDAQISQIMKAPASKRVELMNQLKTKIAAMNSNERNEALQKLSQNMHNGNMHKSSMMQNRPASMPMQPMNTMSGSSTPNRH